MNNKIKFTGGYIGILMILLTVCLIVFLIVRSDIITPKSNGKNMIEEGQDSINRAQDIKIKLEANNLKILD